MRKIIIILLILFFFLIFLLESDRNRYSVTSINDFYINQFPKSFIYGLYNSTFKIINNKFIYNINEFEFYHDFIENRKLIYNELSNFDFIEKSTYSHDDNNILEKDNNYKILKVKFFNKFSYKKNFKTIYKLCEKHKNIRTCFFSIIKGKKIIPYHTGPYCGLLRCHIPIIINKNHNSHMIINDVKINCSEPFIFDDTYVHKLEKLDNFLRIVLIIDIDHPNKLF